MDTSECGPQWGRPLYNFFLFSTGRWHDRLWQTWPMTRQCSEYSLLTASNPLFLFACLESKSPYIPQAWNLQTLGQAWITCLHHCTQLLVLEEASNLTGELLERGPHDRELWGPLWSKRNPESRVKKSELGVGPSQALGKGHIPSDTLITVSWVSE